MPMRVMLSVSDYLPLLKGTGVVDSLCCRIFFFLPGGTKGLLLLKKNVMIIVGGRTMIAPAMQIFDILKFVIF